MERKRLVTWPEFVMVAGSRLVGSALLEILCILGTIGVAISMLAMFVTCILVCLLASSFESSSYFPVLIGALWLLLVTLTIGGVCAALIYGSAWLQNQIKSLPAVAPMTRDNVELLAAEESLLRGAQCPMEGAKASLLRPAGGHPGADQGELLRARISEAGREMS